MRNCIKHLLIHLFLGIYTTIMKDHERLEAELDAIKKRNAHVEVEKAWETSMFRRFVIAIFIYVTTCITLNLNGDVHSLKNALIPAVAYFLSTLSIPFAKKWWMQWWLSKYEKSSK